MVNNYCTIVNIDCVGTGPFWKLMYMKSFFFPPDFFPARSVSQSTSLQEDVQDVQSRKVWISRQWEMLL